MRRVKPVKIRLVYANDPDSPARLRAAYDLIFGLARLELLKQQQGKTPEAGTSNKR